MKTALSSCAPPSCRSAPFPLTTAGAWPPHRPETPWASLCRGPRRLRTWPHLPRSRDDITGIGAVRRCVGRRGPASRVCRGRARACPASVESSRLEMRPRRPANRPRREARSLPILRPFRWAAFAPRSARSPRGAASGADRRGTARDAPVVPDDVVRNDNTDGDVAAVAAPSLGRVRVASAVFLPSPERASGHVGRMDDCGGVPPTSAAFVP